MHDLRAMSWLIRRELTRFLRQPSRIVAAVGTPALVWLVLGAGLAGLSVGGVTYDAYLVPGIASMVVLFASLFASMSLIQDRHEGLLQAVLVSPTPTLAIVGAKVGSCTLLAILQALPVLAAGVLLGVRPAADGWLTAAASLILIASGISGVGIAGAWYVNSMQGFHGVMNLLLMPMWLLSGAVFAPTSASRWMGALMHANPLYWPSEMLRRSLDHAQPLTPTIVIASILFGLTGPALAWAVIARSDR